MISSQQWKNTRQVDHLSLPAYSFTRGFHLAHPRFRDPANRPDLQNFDALVQAYHQTTNNFDRLTLLGSIINQTVNFVAVRGPGDRYGAAANVLHNSALVDINNICGHLHQHALEDWVNNVARPARHIDIHVIILTPVGGAIPGGLPATITAHINNANNTMAFQTANITLQRAVAANTHATQYAGNSILLTAPPAPANKAGCFQPDIAASGGRLIQFCNNIGNANGAQCIDVVYVPDFELDGVAGRTFRAGQTYAGVQVQRPIVLVNSNAPAGLAVTWPTTLAHELGHAICSEGDHSTDPNNLMADGNNRNGNNGLSVGQRAWFCSNNWVH